MAYRIASMTSPWEKKKANKKPWCSSFCIWAGQTIHTGWVGITLHSVRWTCCISKLWETENKLLQCFRRRSRKFADETVLVWNCLKLPPLRSLANQKVIYDEDEWHKAIDMSLINLEMNMARHWPWMYIRISLSSWMHQRCKGTTKSSCL